MEAVGQALPAPLLTPAFVALTLSELAYFTSTGVLLAATPLFVTGPLAGDAAGVGLVMGSFSVSTLALRPFTGRWVDRRGRRPLLIGGAGLFAAVALGHLLATELAVLVVLRLLLGVAEAMYFVAGFAALADLAPPGRAGEALSLNSLALYGGIALGPIIGQAVLSWRGFGPAWVGAAALSLTAALLATRIPETRPDGDEVAPTPLLHRGALVPAFALFCGVAAMAGFLAFAVVHARAVGLETWSLVMVLFGATVVVCRTVFARLPDRVEPMRLVGVSLLVTAAGFVLLGSVPRPAAVLGGALLLGVGTAFLTPAVFAAVFAAVPASERGSAAATTSIFIDLGFGGGPMLLGAVAAATTIPVGFLLLTAVPVLGTLVASAHRPAHVAVT